jgi:hypothetical protein
MEYIVFYLALIGKKKSDFQRHFWQVYGVSAVGELNHKLKSNQHGNRILHSLGEDDSGP